MEHISEILKRQTRTSTSKESTGTWSGAEEETPAGSDCPICKGAGTVYPRLPSGELDYTRLVPCRCVKDRLKGERRARLKQESNLGALQRFTFENIEPQGRSGQPHCQEQFGLAHEAAKAFAAAPEGWLVLGGPSGCGKTHLAAAIANYRLVQGYAVLFITVPDLLDHLRATFSPSSPVSYDRRFEELRTAPLLVLDDLGTHSATAWAKEKLYQLFNYRYAARLPTVITSSLTLDELEQQDSRLFSRLIDPARCRRAAILAAPYRGKATPIRRRGRRKS
jgi:DNA replication protein DnaC